MFGNNPGHSSFNWIWEKPVRFDSRLFYCLFFICCDDAWDPRAVVRINKEWYVSCDLKLSSIKAAAFWTAALRELSSLESRAFTSSVHLAGSDREYPTYVTNSCKGRLLCKQNGTSDVVWPWRQTKNLKNINIKKQCLESDIAACRVCVHVIIDDIVYWLSGAR